MFFSIVIPTKNRPALLRDAIRSVLWQNFTDFELIVSDNHNDENTEAVLQEFRPLPRVKIIKPDQELKMIDHWEFATKHAIGEYVILLADRKVLHQGALKKLKKTILKFPDINAFSVGVQTYDEVIHKMGWCNAIGETHVLKSNELVSNFLNENIFGEKSFDRFFPKTLNGMFKNSFAQKVRIELGHYFNVSGVTTPDYSSFFINTSLNVEIVYIGEKIILTQGEQSSNGRIFGAGQYQAYMDSLEYKDPYKFVPIKAAIIYNLLLVDYLTIREAIKNSPPLSRSNWVNYFKTTYFEILMKREKGLDDARFNFFMEAWDKGIKNYSLAIDVENVIENTHREFNTKNDAVKHYKINRFSHHLRDYLAKRFSRESLINKIFPFVFRDVFHAAGFRQFKKKPTLKI